MNDDDLEFQSGYLWVCVLNANALNALWSVLLKFWRKKEKKITNALLSMCIHLVVYAVAAATAAVAYGHWLIQYSIQSMLMYFVSIRRHFLCFYSLSPYTHTNWSRFTKYRTMWLIRWMDIRTTNQSTYSIDRWLYQSISMPCTITRFNIVHFEK